MVDVETSFSDVRTDVRNCEILECYLLLLKMTAATRLGYSIRISSGKNPPNKLLNGFLVVGIEKRKIATEENKQTSRCVCHKQTSRQENKQTKLCVTDRLSGYGRWNACTLPTPTTRDPLPHAWGKGWALCTHSPAEHR